jgi:citrate synthase
MSHPRYLSAEAAADLLGVKAATLYSYVSRGLIRSEIETDGSRQRRYLAEDVQKLVERKSLRRDPARAAQDALHWGTPVLESSITLITDTHLYFRGHDAAELARTWTFEQVAALIWTDDEANAAQLFGTQPAAAPYLDKIRGLHINPLQAITIALTLAAADDLAAYDLSPAAVARTGARILRLMTAALTDRESSETTIAARLAGAWSPGDVDLFNAALIVSADHELNASSFAARVVAGVDATPYNVVAAGLAALQGFKHGGYTERVSALLREIGDPSRARLTLAERLRRGEGIPGFGHRLYPNGDPRATLLLSMLAEAYPKSPTLALTHAVIAEGTAITGQHPTIDLALAAMEQTLHLPPGAALLLFALGRTAGWIGHASEQYQTQQIIRPRARYNGHPPR